MIIDIEKFLSIRDKLVIDMRTKEEYNKDHIANAINFEILKDQERTKVSILYNKGLNQEAYLLAYEFALDKLPNLFDLIKTNKEKEIVFYCARGGSRSAIVYEVFKNLRGINTYKIDGGYKAYRQYSNAFFSESLDDYDVITVHNFIGTQMHKEMSSISGDYLLIDLSEVLICLENPFDLLDNSGKYLNYKTLNYFIFEKLYFSNTKKIVFIMPGVKNIFGSFHDKLYNLMRCKEHILVTRPLENRVFTIKEKYLQKDFSLELLIDFLDNKRKKMSNVVVDETIGFFKEEQFIKGIESILVNYCDPIIHHHLKKHQLKEFNNLKAIEKFLKNWSE